MHSQNTPFDQAYLRMERGRPDPSAYWAARMHPLAGYGDGAYHDGPSRPHLYGTMDLGQWEEVIGVAADYYAGTGGDGKTGGSEQPSGGPSSGGTATGMQQPGSTATAVSPTFQTQISPQISPTFQQTQDSPGAVQAATATQYMPGGMTARGGGAAAGPPPLPGMPSPYVGAPSPSYFSGPTRPGGLPITPLDPMHLTPISEFPTAGSMIRDIRESEPFNWTPVYIVGGLLVVGGIAVAYFRKGK